MSQLDYESIVQKALRGAVKESLEIIRDNGFSGSHHFYITFETNRTDVIMPDFLREKHPEEITIVLQHQFWDLKVDHKGFSVNLSFNDKQENIKVPYSAIISFLDPSVKFGLQFVPDPAPESAKIQSLPESSDKPAKVLKTKAESTNQSDENIDNVITMDQFRKK